MTYDEMKNLKVGDKIFYKAFNTELTVWDVTVEKELRNCWIQAETESHVSIEFGYLACGEFDVIKKKKWTVKYELTSLLEIEVEADDIDDAIYKADIEVRDTSDEILLVKSYITDVRTLEDEVEESEE